MAARESSAVTRPIEPFWTIELSTAADRYGMTVNPEACITTGPSTPRVTVQVVPETLVTSITSSGLAGSMTWNPVAFATAAGNPVELFTVQDCEVPAAGESVPPELTVVEASFVKISTGTSPPQGRNLSSPIA
jgi:hypothetical protein